jgi:uncharacterized membrane protein YeaQ/YmgE (transglycosylase-associated protein family)
MEITPLWTIVPFWIVAGLIAGWITGKITEGPGYGAPMDIVFGVAGAIIGGFIMRALGFGASSMLVTTFVAVLGAVVLTWIARAFKKPDTISPVRPDPQPPRQGNQSFEPVKFDTSSPLKPAPPPSLGADQAPDARPASTPKDATDRPPPSQARAEIFLSYASPDRPTAARLAKALQDEGWSVWWDRTIPPGKTFDEVIEAALSAAKCVVVLWSEHSVKSDWVKVEAAEGARKRVLIPAIIAEVTIPLEFRRLQAANLSDWPGPDPHLGFETLAASVADLLGRPRTSRANPAGM